MEPVAPIELHIDLAIELRASTWLVAVRMPASDKVGLHRLEAGDTAALFSLFEKLQARVRAKRACEAVTATSCFEAGRDGFWLHRLLVAHGVENYVMEATSILVSRRARRAKTDRLDAQGLLRDLAAYRRGDRQICGMVRVPTPEQEDAKRQHREREHLVQERVRIENRMEALLATQGIKKRPSLRSWGRDLEALRTGDGRPVPPHLRAELGRLHRHLVTTLEMIREVETELEHELEHEAEDPAIKMIQALCRIRGIGENVAAMLTREVLYRPFSNRRQIASYVGLAPMPFQSGEIDRDRKISRAGNPRARTMVIQFACCGCAISRPALCHSGSTSVSAH